MHHYKNNYHPLFIILYLFDLLPYEIVQQIPRTTRNEWEHKHLENCFGFEHCALYTKHFNDVAFAHKYKFTRYTLGITNAIQKTLLTITQHSDLYKKLLRTQKNNIVEHITTLAFKGFTVAKACKLFGLQSNWYYYHKRIINCPLNALKKCYKQHPNQLSFTEQQAIKTHVQLPENKHKNMTQLFYEALNKALVFCGINTFRFYAKKYGYQPPPKPKPERKIGHRASAIFEYLHVDTTYIPTLLDGILKLTMVKDNFSKAPLHYIITKLHINSTIIKNVLEQTFDKYNLFERTHDINIVSDGGPENKGEVLTWIGSLKAPPCIHKLTAYIEPYMCSNNMIESSFNVLKNDFLKGKRITNEAHLIKETDGYLDHCLYRYYSEHYGVTPQQILDGEQPDKHKFKTQMEQARIKRKQANKNFTGCTMPIC
jgi:hypothetical protein